MKKICIVTGNDLTVPAVLGGAVEELDTILLEQNEIEKKVEFVIFTGPCKEAEEIAKSYKHSKVIYVPRDTILEKVSNRIRRYATKLLGLQPGILLDSGYHRKIYKMACKLNADAYVLEGGLYHEFRRFAGKFGKEKIYFRTHCHTIVEPLFDEICGHVVAVSEFSKNEWLRTSKDNEICSHVVYNCVNEEKFNKRISEEERVKVRASLQIAEDDFVVLYCGRIQEVKGVRELLQAFANCDQPKMKLLIIGNADFAVNTITPFMKEVEELVNKDKERIRFTGYVNNSELYKYYQCADIQVMPSMWEEAAGLVAIEGMISGLPLIVTKSGGLIEYAPEDVAVWVDREGIVNNLTKAIGSLYENASLREELSKKSLEHAKKFTKAGYYQNYIKVFGE